MASLDWHLRRTDGITLVELVVRSRTDERIRVESELEPVWPPRTQGVPAAGWDASGFSGTVEADEPLVLGYASPADPVEPPATIVAPRDPDGGAAIDARSLVRTLGDPAPAREAVPDGRQPAEERSDRPSSLPGQPQSTAGLHADGGCGEPTIEDWFDAVDQRIEVAQQLATASDATEARNVVESAGGLAAIRRLAADLDADAQRLEVLARRAARLDERVASVDVPLETLERVA